MLIVANELSKSYKIPKRMPGIVGGLKSIVHKEFTEIIALDKVSFNIGEGELVGYIGPNGAGKSTTIKILSAILTPDSGECTVLGKIPYKDRINYVRDIGVVFGQRTQLWWDLPVIDSFDLLKDIYKIPLVDYVEIKKELIEWLNLGSFINTPVRQLSLGQKMRCELAASLLHSPKVLFLDEPTIGLDAVSKLAVREFIKKLNKERGVTVILTTHDMDDIESLCSRVMVIGKGQILSDGSLQSLRNTVSKDRRLIIDFDEGVNGFSIEGVTHISQEENRLILDFNPEIITPADLITFLSSNYNITDILIENPPIEEIIAKIYGELKI
ncbi:ATP-binding cassette domain-containing protein [Tissierella sp.]|uniref:ABC transporter ATP-binding protein n=1 Tax=Tissierella sp. TaxID=41274 RepID=UPI0028609316|nr:ATP-binding cassette domain-containing protein [Tissierella sp.]MDR7857770.1 ATP-binding cassette domain-containing protein [Tissierella sp.]